MTELLRTVGTRKNITTRPVARERTDPPRPPFASAHDVIFIYPGLEDLRGAGDIRVNNRAAGQMLLMIIRSEHARAERSSCRYYREYLPYSAANARIPCREGVAREDLPRTAPESFLGLCRASFFSR